MAITEADVQTRLRALIDPNTGKDFVSGKAVRKIQIGAGDAIVDIQLGYPAKSQHEAIRKLVASEIAAPCVSSAQTKWTSCPCMRWNRTQISAWIYSMMWPI